VDTFVSLDNLQTDGPAETQIHEEVIENENEVINFQITKENPEWIIEKGKNTQKKNSNSKDKKGMKSSNGPKRTTRVTRASSHQS